MDSYQGAHGDPASLHKCLYANANPVGYRDQSGHDGTLIETMVAEAVDMTMNLMARNSVAFANPVSAGFTSIYRLDAVEDAVEELVEANGAEIVEKAARLGPRSIDFWSRLDRGSSTWK